MSRGGRRWPSSTAGGRGHEVLRHWTRFALRQLLDLLTTATDPTAVEDASLRIDQALAADAATAGEGRGGDVRILFEPPIAVLFVADDAVGVAYVVAVGWSGQPG